MFISFAYICISFFLLHALFGVGSNTSYQKKDLVSHPGVHKASVRTTTQSTTNIVSPAKSLNHQAFIEKPSNQSKASRSHDKFLPTPFQSVLPNPHSFIEHTGTVPLKTKGEFAREIDKLIKDVYSEREVPFTPFEAQKTIPEWIFLQQTQQGDEMCQEFKFLVYLYACFC